VKLKLAQIPPEGGEFDRVLEQAWLREVLSGAGSVDFWATEGRTVKVFAKRTGVEVLVQSDFFLELTTDCSTCLEDFRLEVPVAFSLTLRPRPAGQDPMPADLELRSEDLEEFFFDGEEIDLEGILREQILLALPMYPRCSENCRGLCPVCGANLNKGECGCDRGVVDPRWATLKKIAEK